MNLLPTDIREMVIKDHKLDVFAAALALRLPAHATVIQEKSKESFYLKDSLSLDGMPIEYHASFWRWLSQKDEKVETIRILHSSLSSVRVNRFHGLEVLELSGNYLTLDEHVSPFSGLASLRFLHLQNNRITCLGQGLFRGLCRLEKLWLDNNPISTIEDGAFRDLSRLEVFTIDDNQLTELRKDMFVGLSDLSEFSMCRNRLTTLKHGVFDFLPEIRDIDLAGNQLVVIEDNVFSGLRHLNSLILSDNRLTSLDKIGYSRQLPQESVNLVDLILDGNQFRHIRRCTFTYMRYLMSLKLNYCELETIENGAFQGLRLLR